MPHLTAVPPPDPTDAEKDAALLRHVDLTISRAVAADMVSGRAYYNVFSDVVISAEHATEEERQEAIESLAVLFHLCSQNPKWFGELRQHYSDQHGGTWDDCVQCGASS